jgi:hypothetical protein
MVAVIRWTKYIVAFDLALASRGIARRAAANDRCIALTGPVCPSEEDPRQNESLLKDLEIRSRQ